MGGLCRLGFHLAPPKPARRFRRHHVRGIKRSVSEWHIQSHVRDSRSTDKQLKHTRRILFWLIRSLYNSRRRDIATGKQTKASDECENNTHATACFLKLSFILIIETVLLFGVVDTIIFSLFWFREVAQSIASVPIHLEFNRDKDFLIFPLQMRTAFQHWKKVCDCTYGFPACFFLLIRHVMNLLWKVCDLLTRIIRGRGEFWACCIIPSYRLESRTGAMMSDSNQGK